MRTLKKTLCLVLVLAMVLSLGVTNIFAATDFTDDADIEFAEAATVLDAIDVIQGNGDGTFNPKGGIERAQACAIIARLVAPDLDVRNAGYTTDSFSDVPADRWYMSEIAYCEAMGYIVGNGDGTFGPEDEITGTAFAKLLLVALGYDADKEGLQNSSSWQINIDRLARASGTALNNGITGLNLTNVLTRDRAAQMSLNALKADMVYYDASTGQRKNEEDASANDYRASEVAKGSGNMDKKVQLIEKYFPGLKLQDTSVADTDEFDRPSASKWTLDDASGTPQNVFVKAEKTAKSYTAAVTSANFAKDFPSATYSFASGTGKVANSGCNLFVNGKDESGNANSYISSGSISTVADLYKLTANGRVVEIYTDDSKITNIVIIDYKTGELEIKTDEETGDVTYTIKGTTPTVSGTVYADNEKNGDNTVVCNGTVANKDVVTYAVVENAVRSAGKDASADPDINALYLWPTDEVETGVQTSTRVDSSSVRYVTVNGTEYTVGKSANLTGDSNFANNTDSDKTFGFYTDQYGYMVYRREITDEETSDTNYAVILKIYKIAGGASDDSFQATLLLPDGSQLKNVDVELDTENSEFKYYTTTMGENMSQSNAENNKGFYGMIVTYELEDGVYTLTDVTTNDGQTKNHMVGDSNTSTNKTVITENGNPEFAYAGTGTNALPSGSTELAYDGTIFIVANSSTTKVDTATDTRAATWLGGGSKVQTAFLDVTLADTYTVYTGFEEVPDITLDADKVAQVTYVKDADGVALVFIDYGKATNNVAVADPNAASDILYVADKSVTKSGSGTSTLYSMKGYVNGDTTAKTLTGKNGKLQDTDTLNSKFENGGLYVITQYDADGNVNAFSEATLGDIQYAPSGSVWHIDGGNKTYDANTAAYVITNNSNTSSYTIKKGAVTDAAIGDEAYIIYAKDKDNNDTSKIETVYIVKTEGTAISLTGRVDATTGNIVVTASALPAGKTVTSASTDIVVIASNTSDTSKDLTPATPTFDAGTRVASVSIPKNGSANGNKIAVVVFITASDGTIYKGTLTYTIPSA